MLQNEWESNILDRLYHILFKIIILSQIGGDGYQKLIFETLLLSPPWRTVDWYRLGLVQTTASCLHTKFDITCGSSMMEQLETRHETHQKPVGFCFLGGQKKRPNQWYFQF